jgi:hypothetical protein
LNGDWEGDGPFCERHAVLFPSCGFGRDVVIFRRREAMIPAKSLRLETV